MFHVSPLSLPLRFSELKLSDITQHDTDKYSDQLAPVIANLHVLSKALRDENITLSSEDTTYLQRNLNNAIDRVKKKRELNYANEEEDA